METLGLGGLLHVKKSTQRGYTWGRSADLLWISCDVLVQLKKRHICADATTTLMYSAYIGYGMGTGPLFVRKIKLPRCFLSVARRGKVL